MELTQSFIKEKIDEAELQFESCFNILCNILSEQNSGEGFLDFQPKLADTLFEIMSVHKEVCAEEKNLSEIRIISLKMIL